MSLCVCVKERLIRWQDSLSQMRSCHEAGRSILLIYFMLCYSFAWQKFHPGLLTCKEIVPESHGFPLLLLGGSLSQLEGFVLRVCVVCIFSLSLCESPPGAPSTSHIPKTMMIPGLIGYSKLATGVDVSQNCLTLCVSSRTVQSLPRILPSVSRDRFQPHG